jgi:hypothetical protein
MHKCKCGGKPILLKFDFYYDVSCLKCLKKSEWSFTRIAAIADWNAKNKKGVSHESSKIR